MQPVWESILLRERGPTGQVIALGTIVGNFRFQMWPYEPEGSPLRQVTRTTWEKQIEDQLKDIETWNSTHSAGGAPFCDSAVCMTRDFEFQPKNIPLTKILFQNTTCDPSQKLSGRHYWITSKIVTRAIELSVSSVSWVGPGQHGAQSTVVPVIFAKPLGPLAKGQLSQTYSTMLHYEHRTIGPCYMVKTFPLDLSNVLQRRRMTVGLSFIDNLQGCHGLLESEPALIAALFPRQYNIASHTNSPNYSPPLTNALTNLYAADIISRNRASYEIAEYLMTLGHQTWHPHVRSAPLYLRDDRTSRSLEPGLHLAMEIAEGKSFHHYLSFYDATNSLFHRDVAPLTLWQICELIRQITWLQITDYIVGQCDRSINNVFFCPQNLATDPSAATFRAAICGIDNDASLPAYDFPSYGVRPRYDQRVMVRCACDHTPTHLPLIDEEMYDAIVNCDPSVIRRILENNGRTPDLATCYDWEYFALALRLLVARLVAEDSRNRNRVYPRSIWSRTAGASNDDAINLIALFGECDTAFRTLFDCFSRQEVDGGVPYSSHWRAKLSRLTLQIEYGYRTLPPEEREKVRTCGDLMALPVHISSDLADHPAATGV